LAQPASDRIVYRTILQAKVGRIVELGIGQAERSLRMIDAAARQFDRAEVQYIGIDPFEGRTDADGPGLSLIDAHRKLKQSEAKIKLIPGDPCDALARSANLLHDIDLLLIAVECGEERLRRLCFFLPRMMHDRSIVLMEDGKKGFRQLESSEIRRLGEVSQRRKAA
jgi:hypothetical protein